MSKDCGARVAFMKKTMTTEKAGAEAMKLNKRDMPAVEVPGEKKCAAKSTKKG